MSPPPTRPANRLAHETSPYLLQHAHNPVDWYPWGPEALAKARAEDKPILLSVGYAACHWCHVMERESFEDPATAAQMNQHFVNIKVDREERPDLDELYMGAVQAFSGGHGGWPMTVFLSPDGAPFFGGTYFPPVPRHGMPSFSQVLGHIRQTWAQRRAEVGRTTAELATQLRQAARLPAAASELKADWLDRILRAAEADFDPKDAGFGGAPKFPPHGTLAALLAHHGRTGDRRSLRIATDTLDAMARGGMADLAGGGFCRYSVDARWAVPHFEKMLYDNAQLVPLYLDAWRITGAPRYRRVVLSACDWILREMQLPDGGFASALDADSDNGQGVSEEGAFYCWTPTQLREVLGFVDGMRVAALLQVTDAGSFEHGQSVLRLEPPFDSLDPADQALLDRALPALLQARSARPRPGIDDKVITAWNGMMLGALAQAGAALGEDRYLEAAEKNAAFLLDHLVVNGRLQRTWRQGKAHVPAFADDHAALIGGLTDLFMATGERAWLDEALGLSVALVRLFWDEADGGLFYAGHDAESLLTRSKKMLGGAEPSANGQAALAFARLATLCGREDLGALADAILARYQPIVEKAPRALGVEAIAAAWRTGRVAELAIVGDPEDPRTDALLAAAWSQALPFAVLAPVPAAELAEATARMPWLEGKPGDAAPTAYLCEGSSCRAPTRDPDALRAQLQQQVQAPPRPPGFGRDRAPALPTDAGLWLNTVDIPTIESLKGQVVLLDFWTSCCINCLHVLPELAAVEARFAGRPVRVIGVHSAKFPMEEELDAVRRAVERQGLRHPVVHDPDHDLWEAYAVKGWPTLVLLDTQGRIAWRQSGEVDRDTLTALITRELDEAAEAGLPVGIPTAEAPVPEPAATALRFPGKLAIYPPTGAQEQGADPFTGAGRLYIADTGHHQIIEARLELARDGWPVARVLRRFGSGAPGLADGSAETARFCAPQGMDRTGDSLYVADTGNHALRSIDVNTGEVRTLAGTGVLGRAGDSSGALRSPWDVAAGGPEAGAANPGQEIVFVAMAGAHQIWVYVPSTGRFSPFVGSGQEAHVDGPPAKAALAQPSGLELYGRYLFFADSEVSSVRFLDLQDRQVGTLVGQGLFDFGDQDGKGEDVLLQHPLDVAVAGGRVWVADTYNHKIKSIRMSSGETITEAGGPNAQGRRRCVSPGHHPRRRLPAHRRHREPPPGRPAGAGRGLAGAPGAVSAEGVGGPTSCPSCPSSSPCRRCRCSRRPPGPP